MIANFSFADFFGSLLVLAVFPLFTLIPGYTLGWLLNLVRFRERTPLLRLCLSLPLSLALIPAVLFFLGWHFTVAAVWLFLAVLACVFVVLCIRRDSRPLSGSWPRHFRKTVTCIAVVWTAISILSLIDLQLGHRLYYSVVAYDYTLRSGVVSALTRSLSYPPPNPFFFDGHASPFRYHYFLFMFCSLPNRLLSQIFGHAVVSPRYALIATVVVVGFALLSTVALYLRFFCSLGRAQIRRRFGIAIALLSISGLDIVVAGSKLLYRIVFHKNNVNASVDWWNNDEVTGWLGTALWVPHHLAGLLACLMGFLVLWDHHQELEARPKWQVILGAALCFAGGAGLSVYVAFAFAAFLALWSLYLLWRGTYSEFAALAISGVLAGVIATPFLLTLFQAGSAGSATAETGQSSFVVFGVRHFTPSIVALTAVHKDHPAVLLLSNLLFLPINYFLEFGFFFVVAVLRIRGWNKIQGSFTRSDAATLAMFSSAVILCTFVRSNTITNNDLGMRGMLVAQFALVLWGVDLLCGLNLRRAGQILTITFLVGAATNLYELVILRTFTLFADSKFSPGENSFYVENSDFGRRTFDYREAYDWLDRHTPVDAVEQQFPLRGDLSSGLYANRQIAFLDYGTSVSFGINPPAAQTMKQSVDAQFAASAPGSASFCGNLPIDFVVVRRLDALWEDPASWVWRRDPIFKNANARAYACR